MGKTLGRAITGGRTEDDTGVAGTTMYDAESFQVANPLNRSELLARGEFAFTFGRSAAQ